MEAEAAAFRKHSYITRRTSRRMRSLRVGPVKRGTVRPAATEKPTGEKQFREQIRATSLRNF